jgi:hypothetical protein
MAQVYICIKNANDMLEELIKQLEIPPKEGVVEHRTVREMLADTCACVDPDPNEADCCKKCGKPIDYKRALL